VKRTYVALLRGVNVSGQNAIRMAALKASLASLGFEDVRTYLQSGNVVFMANQSAAAKLAIAIEARIARDFNCKVPVFVMSAEELNSVASSNPLWPKAGGDERTFHATFLFQPILARAFKALKLPASSSEAAVLAGQVILLHCPDGYGRTKLSNSFFERALAVSATTRNWRTVLALRQLCEAP
jgi:uncharacterized protein (DUF1697 family)